jgi:ATP/maltotriose-dependent transcriptional regulator MalT
VIAQVTRAEDKSFLAYVTEQEGEIEAALGQLAQARATMEKTLQLGRQIGEHPRIVEALMLGASLAATAGKLDEAERQLDEAASELQAIAPATQLRDVTIARAELRLMRGQAKEAEASAREIVDKFDQHDPVAVDGRIQAMETLARALLAQHKIREAHALVDRAVSLMPAEPQLETQLRVELVRAGVEASEGHVAAARKRAARALAEARRVHHAPLELRARLFDVMLAPQPPTAANAARARALADEATRRGYLIIARQAAALAP